MEKEKCDCGKTAIWYYSPELDIEPENRFFCDNCVPRGCTCNHYYVSEFGEPETEEQIQWSEDKKYWFDTDKQGREYPCCEYDYNKKGFNKKHGKRKM